MTRPDLPLLGAVALLASPVLAVTPAGQGPTVFVTDSTEKIRPTVAARPFAPAHIYAAQNEFEAFQIVVMGSATNVSAAATPLTNHGSTISEIRLYREGVLNCTQ